MVLLANALWVLLSLFITLCPLFQFLYFMCNKEMEELECGCAESQEWGLPMNPKYNKKHKEVKNEEFMVK